MNNISTIMLVLELRNRLDEQLHGEIESLDPVVETLLRDQDCMYDQLDSLHNVLHNVTQRYYQILRTEHD